MKMNTLAKNQKVCFARCEPRSPSRNPHRLSTSHSRKFCEPSGTPFMFRVATWAKTMSPIVTIQVTTIELVIGKPNGRAISTALCERLLFLGAVAESVVDVISSAVFDQRIRPSSAKSDRDGDEHQPEADHESA